MVTLRKTFLFAALAFSLLAFGKRAEALDQLCDSAFENCRTPLLDLINAETQSIDIGMWFMEDDRFAQAIVKRFQAGVSVRILMDPRANSQHPEQPFILNELKNAGIPMRNRTASGIEHWKIMIFGAQDKIYFGSANFSADAFVYVTPYVNYVDETVYFTNDLTFVNTFRSRFDDAWTDTANYANYANVSTPLTRRYPPFSIDPEVNVPPGEDFINRSVAQINGENQQLDAVMYRIADERPLTALLSAKQRGVPIRLLVAPDMYHDPTRLDVSYYFDRLYAAGVPIKVTTHQGVNHGKLALLYGNGMTIFGSSNWTTPSGNSQHENNYFTLKTVIFNYFIDYFERRWNNTAPGGIQETGPFVPQQPDKPVNQAPASGATGVATSGAKIKWYGGMWAWSYDIYFGTDPNPPLFAANRTLGPSRDATQFQSFTLPTLKPGTTYYWKIGSRTAANMTRVGNVSSFTTAGSAAPPDVGAATVVLWTANVAAADIHGDWARIADQNAAGSTALQNPDRGRAKIAPALASPANYFEIPFDAKAGTPYHLWVRMNAQNNSASNDSVHVQFTDSVDGAGNPVARIGSTASFEPVQQNGPSGPAPQGWGWTDNGWGSIGANVYFNTTGSHVLRIQQREDGPSIDQIVLSPDSFLSVAPGPHSNDATILQASAGNGQPPPPPPPPPDVVTTVLWTKNASDGDIHGSWQRVSDATAAGGSALRNPNANAAKIAPAMSNPTSYFDMSFTARAQTAYHVWLRMKADSNSLSNDSVHVQFNDSVDASNNVFARIGTSGSIEPVLQSGPNGPSPHGWGWADNGWDFLGTHVYFATDGPHTIRVQQREDGVTIDQIVISPDTYLMVPPGNRFDDTTLLPADGGGPPPCTFTIAPTSQSVAATGGSGSTAVTASVQTCTWAASSNAPSWLTITSGSSGAGDGNVSFSAAANSGTARSGTLTVAGKTFTVNQAGTSPTCTFTIAPTSQSVPASGGSGSTAVTVSDQTCGWTASSNATSWLTITSGTSGNGDGNVSFSAAANSGTARSGTLTVAGKTFTVNQAGSSTPPPGGTVVLWLDAVPADQIHGNWRVGTDTGAGGVSIWNPNADAPKVAPALASPTNYFELTFQADAGVPYHVWIRMRAQSNSTGNDSIHMQFDNAVDGGGASYAAIGSTSSAELVLQNGPSGAAPHSWGWTDSGWGSLGPNVFFATSGTQRLRIQQREDGAIIDQIVISPDTYLTTPPGARTDDTTVLPKTP